MTQWFQNVYYIVLILEFLAISVSVKPVYKGEI